MSDPIPPDPPLLPVESRPRRRPRYSGRNPRRFDEKYKELNPIRYPDLTDKLIASGKTPVGTHRPILVPEVLSALALSPGQVAVDCTLGYGGHARAIMDCLRPGGRLVGLDVDPIEQPKTIARLRAAGYREEEFLPIRRNFAGLPQVLAELGWESVDAIFADLGVSSMQLDDPTRGFTFKEDGPLDLRLNPQRSPSASQWLATVTVDQLEDQLIENADEPRAAILARELVAVRQRLPLTRTHQLTEALREILRRHAPDANRDSQNLCIRRVFQTLRIAVNDEFGALETLLRNLPFCLKPGGRVCLLTFHSGEDRRVKKSFQAGERSGLYSEVAHELVRPSAEEVRSNPRSASAKLRWAVRARD